MPRDYYFAKDKKKLGTAAKTVKNEHFLKQIVYSFFLCVLAYMN
jgi:hypothetical protein